MLKIVVLGYGKMAQSIILGVLQSKHELVGVMRWQKDNPDWLTARIKDAFVPDNLVSLLRTNNIKEVNAQKANSDAFVAEMKRLAPDVIIVASWGEIIKKELFNLPKIAFINCHPSLLPKHRGSNPYVSVIKEGEKKTGVTFHLLDEEIDSGDILLQEEIIISEDETQGSLKPKCSYTAKQMVKTLLDGLETNSLIPEKQQESEATYYRAIEEEDVIIDWNNSAELIHRQIRAFQPENSCYSLHGNEIITFDYSKVVPLKKPVKKAGMVIQKKGCSILVSTGDPDNAILAENIKVYGFLSEIRSVGIIKQKIIEGSFFRKV